MRSLITLTLLAIFTLIGCVTINKYYVILPKETAELKSNDPIQFPFDGIDDWGGDPGFYKPISIPPNLIVEPDGTLLIDSEPPWKLDTSSIDNDFYIIDPAKCEHNLTTVTTLGSTGKNANTYTCISCGKQWKCN